MRFINLNVIAYAVFITQNFTVICYTGRRRRAVVYGRLDAKNRKKIEKNTIELYCTPEFRQNPTTDEPCAPAEAEKKIIIIDINRGLSHNLFVSRARSAA